MVEVIVEVIIVLVLFAVGWGIGALVNKKKKQQRRAAGTLLFCMVLTATTTNTLLASGAEAPKPPPGAVRPPSLNQPWRPVDGPPKMPPPAHIWVPQNEFLLPATPLELCKQNKPTKPNNQNMEEPLRCN